jgi:hypothetical protein
MSTDMRTVQKEIRRLLNRTNKAEVNRVTVGPAFAHEVIDRVCVAQNIPDFATTKKFHCIRPQLTSRYDVVNGFCDDYCPPSLACISSFIVLLDRELSSHPSCKIVLSIDDGRRALTRAVFLLGAFMLLKLDYPAEEVLARFSWLQTSSLEPFRHAAASLPDIPLSPLDCWRALERGRALGWVLTTCDPDASPAPPAHVAAAAAAAAAITRAVEEQRRGRAGPECTGGAQAGLCLMRRHGFAAREAVGWLGIVWPGCAAGRDQHGLCGVEWPRRRLGAFIPSAAYRGGVSAVAG